MKMTTQHFDALKAAIEPLDTTERRAAYLEGRFPRSDKVKYLDTRYRWDLFWAVKGYQIFGDRHSYETSHIDTVLRRIVAAL